jgi:hypothetical protein
MVGFALDRVMRLTGSPLFDSQAFIYLLGGVLAIKAAIL